MPLNGLTTDLDELTRGAERELGESVGAPSETRRRPRRRRKTASMKIDTPAGPYLPRMVGGERDVDLIAEHLRAGRTILLPGEPGGGKTALAEAVAVVLESSCHTALCTVGADAGVGLGRWTARGPGNFVWVDGPFTRAVQVGGIAFLDELGQLEHREQMSFAEALDSRRRLTVADHEGEIYVVVTAEGVTASQQAWIDQARIDGYDVRVGEAGFGALIAFNPDLRDAPGIAEPILDRCDVVLEIYSSFETALELGVNEGLVDVARTMARLARDGKDVWRVSTRAMLTHRNLERTHGTDHANRALLSRCRVEARNSPEAFDHLQRALCDHMDVETLDPLDLRDDLDDAPDPAVAAGGA